MITRIAILLLIMFKTVSACDTTSVTGQLTVDKQKFHSGEVILFRYLFDNQSGPDLLTINTPVLAGKASFGVGIMLKNQENRIYRFIRTPFWHYALTGYHLDFSDSSKQTLIYIHNPDNDHCRLIQESHWIDNSPAQQKQEGSRAFDDALPAIPPGRYTAWFEVTLEEMPKLDDAVLLRDINSKPTPKPYCVHSQPTQFEVLHDSR